jgi:hypothetical protein
MTDVTAQGSDSSYPSHLVLTAAEARLIVFGVLIAMMMAALDQTIVSTALSTIGRELGNSTQLTWVVTAYLLSATVVTPIYGKLSDLYGRRVTLLVAVSVFIAGSGACALAPSMIVLIIARTFQGLGGGGLISLSQTIIGDIIPPKQRAVSSLHLRCIRCRQRSRPATGWLHCRAPALVNHFLDQSADRAHRPGHDLLAVAQAAGEP